MPSNSSAINIAPLLDDGNWSTYQKLALLMAALTIVFDGMDIQALGFAIPSMMKEFSAPRAVFATIAAVSLIGMSIGTMIAGAFGDRFGRKPVLVGCVIFFGMLTAATAFADDVMTLGILRFVAGLGLGGALPNATTLSAEFTPTKHRALGVVLTIVCVPFGGMLGGLIAGEVLPTQGWRALFLIAGLIPVAVGVLLIFILPESPRFLVHHPRRQAELIKLLNRCGHRFGADTSLVDLTEKVEGRFQLSLLFSSEYLRNTLLLWAGFFFCYVATYALFSWLPSMLAGAGFGLAVASKGLTAFNLGGVVGAISAAVLIGRLGSKRVLLVCAGGAVAVALWLPSIPLNVADPSTLIVGLAIAGAFINAVQSSLFALAAHVYASYVRATGSGAAIGVGRIGAVLSSFLGAAVLQLGGSDAFYGLIALTMCITFITLALLDKHIQRSK